MFFPLFREKCFPELIEEVANNESCVIVGRCADFILKDKENVLKIFIDSSMQDKINRATEYYKLDKNKAEKEITRINKLRANHYKLYRNGMERSCQL